MKNLGVIYTDLYKDIIENGKIDEYIEKEGAKIYNSGTIELIEYIDENYNVYSVRLDVLDDLKTPSFHVKKNSDDEYLKTFNKIGDAEKDFYNIFYKSSIL